MIVLATLTGVAVPLDGQSVYDSVRTGSGYCHLWQMPPGGSDFPQDASFTRCALDRPPILRHAPAVPPPRIGFYAGGSFLIVVNPDGSVDQDRTRASTIGEDREFHERALEAIRRWHFAPGVRGGKPVRSAFPLWIVSSTRNDTLRHGSEAAEGQPLAVLPAMAKRMNDAIVCGHGTAQLGAIAADVLS